MPCHQSLLHRSPGTILLPGSAYPARCPAVSASSASHLGCSAALPSGDPKLFRNKLGGIVTYPTPAIALQSALSTSLWMRFGRPLSVTERMSRTSSPMLARAAQSDALWPHALALGWQALCVLLFVRFGAQIFRRRVMKSGKGGRAVKGHVGSVRAR